MNLKMVLLQSAWNDIFSQLPPDTEAMGTDNVIPIFAALIAKAGIEDIQPQLHFMESEFTHFP